MVRVSAVRALALGLLLPAFVAAPSAAAGGGFGFVSRYELATAEGADRLVPGSGAAAYGVDDEGTLWLAVSLRHAAPDAEHEVYLVCGPTLAEACGDALLSVLVTDARGDADSTEIGVALADLQAAPFGAGPRLDHLMILESIGVGAYMSDPLAYSVP